MYPYWLLFAFFAAGTFFARPLAISAMSRALFGLGGLGMALMIGLRFQVGGDWGTYQRVFDLARYADLGILVEGDPAYQLINLVVQRIDGEFWLVNLVCGAIFTWGLFRFASMQSQPWLAILVAIPYVVIVVAMGYTRHSVAIGLLLAGFAALQKGASSLRFGLYLAGGAMFHRTAVAVMPLVVLASRRNTLLTLLGVVAATILLFDLLVASSFDRLVRNYIEEQLGSQGAAVRVAMNIVPATLFLLRPHAFGFEERLTRIWRYFSLLAFVFLALLMVFPSSTVIDRLALYLTPLQIAVLSRVPDAYRSGGVAKLLIVAYLVAVQFVWLNYAAHAADWLPYQLYPLSGA